MTHSKLHVYFFTSLKAKEIEFNEAPEDPDHLPVMFKVANWSSVCFQAI